MMKIPINYEYIYDFTPEDFERYPNEKLYTGTFWEETYGEVILHYNDKPILKVIKYFVTYNRDNVTGCDTYYTLKDMSDDIIETKKIETIQAHNILKDELPQLNDIVEKYIREFKINELLYD